MCGINGIYKFDKIVEKDIETVLKMSQGMRYRGPDDFGEFYNERIALSQVRLSIIGIANGKHPIFNENGNLVIICNGEIYNYKELKEDLISKGHIFTTDSDSEVILHLFEEKKEKCLDYFNGMYAFAIYDIKNEKLFIARDYCGKKPLYYSQTPNGFVFSSELLAIKNNVDCNFDVNEQELKRYMEYSFSQSMSSTYIDQIKKLEAGQYGYITTKGCSFKRYWKKKNTYSYKDSYESAKQETLSLLKNAVNLRLRSDVPVAIMLSGGIDSSAIVSFASEVSNNINAITVGYKGAPATDERELAKKLAQEKKVNWIEIELDENDYAKYFEEYVQYLDEPVSDLSSISQYAIYKKAKELGFTVLLSGNGGDELFYGYPLFNELVENMNTIKELSTLKRRPRKYLKYVVSNYSKIKKLIKTYNNESYKFFYHKYYDEFNYEWKRDNEFYQSNFREKYYNDETENPDKVYSYMFNVWLSNNCYYLSDKLGMANSLELRCPFADRKLIEFVSSLPIEYKYFSNKPKWFLKEILRGIVPNYILDAPKRGFEPAYKSLERLIMSYNSKFFKTKINGYPQLLMDEFLSINKLKL